MYYNTPMSTVEKLSPPLKWAGGKRWLVPRLAEIWADHRQARLVEPFCGGLAVALGLQPHRALLNDINEHVINFYRQLQSGFEIKLELHNDEDFYYQQRDRFNELVHHGEALSPEGAAIFYYMNRTGYNGLCRFNNSGEFNVPFGSYKTINYRYDFSAYQAALHGWSFRAGDFTRLKLKPDDFIYADPPYDVEFTKYSKRDFAWEDQERLAHWLAQHPGPVVLSNQATDRIVALYADLDFDIQFLEGPRRISSNGDRSKAPELLATRGL